MSEPSTERAIVTVLNLVGPTSMPFNEFVAYRARAFPEEHHVVVSLAPVDPDALRRAAEALPPERLAVVDCGGSWRGLAHRSLAAARQARERHGRTLVHLHQPLSGALFQLARAWRRADLPVLFTVHNCFDHYSVPTRLLCGLNLALAREVTVVSEASRAALPTGLRRLRRAPVRAVPNGVDLERVDRTLAVLGAQSQSDAPAEPRPAGGLRLLHVGRFVPQKQHGFLLELLARLPAGVTLTLVGDGPLRPQIVERAHALGLAPRVRCTGIIPREAVYAEMLRADVFVSCSAWEGLPIAVLEAMALRRPVLLSDIGPHREIAGQAAEAVLLPAAVESWVAALEWWRTAPVAELARIGADNRRAVEDGLSLQRMHRSYTTLYERLLGAPAAASPGARRGRVVEAAP